MLPPTLSLRHHTTPAPPTSSTPLHPHATYLLRSTPPPRRPLAPRTASPSYVYFSELSKSQQSQGQLPFKILLAFSGLQHNLPKKRGCTTRVFECKEAAHALLCASGCEDASNILCNVDLGVYEAQKGLVLQRLQKHVQVQPKLIVATGGHDKKAVLWCTEPLKLKSLLEKHSSLITDVRFSQSMSRLATSSFDKIVRVWDADNTGYSLRTFTSHSHSASVMSLDFHPNKEFMICSYDINGEIRSWSINNGSCLTCVKVIKGGAT